MYNLFTSRLIEEGVRNRNQHLMLEDDANKLCHVVHSDPVNISLELLDASILPKTKITFCLSRYDAEEYLNKFTLFLQSLHGVKNSVIFEINNFRNKIEFAFYTVKEDSQNVTNSIATYFPNSYYYTVSVRKQKTIYQCISYVPDIEAPFYTALTPPDFIVSPLNSVVEGLLQSKSKVAFQVMFTPLQEDWHNKVSSAIDCDYVSRLPVGNGPQGPSLSRDTDRERYKSPDYKEYFSVVVRVLSKRKQEMSSFISSYVYGRKSFVQYNYESTRFSSKMQGWIVNTSELCSFVHVPCAILNNHKVKDSVISTPPGQIPLDKKCNRSILGYWKAGKITKKIYIHKERTSIGLLLQGKPRQGKSCLIRSVIEDEVKKNHSTVIIIDPASDLVVDICKSIPKKDMHRVMYLDFGHKTHVPAFSIKANLVHDNISLSADDISSSIQGATADGWGWGPRMILIVTMMAYVYCSVPEMNFDDLVTLTSNSKEGKNFRAKASENIDHPIVSQFLKIDSNSFTEAQWAPVQSRLLLLLLSKSLYKLFHSEKNLVNFEQILSSKTNYIVLINIGIGKVGKQTAELLGALVLNILSCVLTHRMSLPFADRKRCVVGIDEWHTFAGAAQTLSFLIEGGGKLNLDVILANQSIQGQLDPRLQQTAHLCGTQVHFRINEEDASRVVKETQQVELNDILSLNPFEAFSIVGKNTYKIHTPKPSFPETDLFDEIMANCIDKYYIPIDEDEPKQKLDFDTI